MKEATPIDNVTHIKEAFEQPGWYLQRTAYNITLRTETVAEFLNGIRCDSILDIGCGDGSLSLHLLNEDNHVTFLDQSQTMLGIVRSRVPAQLSTQINTLNSGFMEAKLVPDSFDLIICVGVLAYIQVQDRRDFINKIKSLLKPGGLLILECTDGPHIISRIGRGYASLVKILKPSKMRTIVGSSSKVLEICRELGFELQGTFRYSLPLPIISKLMSQKTSYDAIRRIYGSAKTNHRPSLGNECLYYFRIPTNKK
ncbi:MAG TPA: class I SAM-dependent methyltransferase [Phycisphaerae bacterium]|nr:class I SAM-dependent methyltransferase [Phycisphaerae bacterium]